MTRDSFQLSCDTFFQVIFYYIKCLVKREDHLIFTRGKRNEPLRENDTFKKLLYLYYNSMDHDCLFACLKELVRQTSIGNMKTSSRLLWRTLKDLSRQPRSLKSLSRYCVYKSLGRKLVPAVNKLQLPVPLKEYLMDFS